MPRALTKTEIVSSEQEALILVNCADEECGFLDKAECHDGEGILHRAFSLFIFNPAGELLVQQRGADKRLWPLYWSNSCCSHPRRGESMDVAVARRLEQELGLQAELSYVYKFEYSAAFGDIGTEHELCWVYVGMSTAQPVTNTTEINAWRWVSQQQLSQELELQPQSYTPWLQLEWQHLQSHHAKALPAASAETPPTL
jgi:isopentenyl-diphosphate delta-isomerase